MYTSQMSGGKRAQIMARVDAMHAREGITGQEAEEARAAGWHADEDVEHEPMTLADAIVKAAGR